MKTIHILAILSAITPFVTAQDWLAGRDLKAAELLGGALELQNPNAAVPEWSYGRRSVVASTALTLFSGAGDHSNNLSSPDVQGWWNAGGVPVVGVNVGAVPVVFNFGFGPLTPMQPGEMHLHPAPGEAAVVRWTAPYAGDFIINATWEDADPYGGSGAAGFVVINGVITATGTWANGTGNGFSDFNHNVPLAAGDTVDFVLGSNGDFLHDSTQFNASIVPEPSSALLLLGGIALLARRRK